VKNIFDFLVQLCINNNREWFDDNRSWYKQVKGEMEDVVGEIIHDLQKMDPSLHDVTPKNSIFRIFRDVRFSNDKTPYKTNMGAFMVPGGRKNPKAGYYIHIEPDNSFLAGGIYMPPSPVLKQLRTGIYENIDEYKSIITNAAFIEMFGSVEGDSLKTAPKGFPKDFPDVDLIKLKSYNVLHKITDEEVLDPEFKSKTIDVFRAMKPFNQFLNSLL